MAKKQLSNLLFKIGDDKILSIDYCGNEISYEKKKILSSIITQHYNITVTNSSNQTWSIYKRFAEIDKLRTKLLEKLCDNIFSFSSKCNGCCSLVKNILEINYPRKTLFPAYSKNSKLRLYEKRKSEIKLFLKNLCDVVSSHKFQKCVKSSKFCNDILFEFLDIRIHTTANRLRNAYKIEAITRRNRSFDRKCLGSIPEESYFLY